MSKTLALSEAKARLSELVATVEQTGEELVITSSRIFTTQSESGPAIIGRKFLSSENLERRLSRTAKFSRGTITDHLADQGLNGGNCGVWSRKRYLSTSRN